MTYEEARETAVIRYYGNTACNRRWEAEESVDAIIEAAVLKMKEELGQTTTTAGLHQVVNHDYIRPKSMPEVRAKGWDDAVQAAVRVCDEFLEGDGYKEARVTLKLLREQIRALGGNHDLR